MAKALYRVMVAARDSPKRPGAIHGSLRWEQEGKDCRSEKAAVEKCLRSMADGRDRKVVVVEATTVAKERVLRRYRGGKPG